MIHFKELYELRYYRIMEHYIGEFRRIAIKFLIPFERRIVVLFVKGLAKPLRGLVKELEPYNP